MRGVYFLGNRKLDIADIPEPTQGPGEVILEIRASGMCGSDLRVYRAAETLDVNEDIIRTQKTLMGSWTFSIAGQAECARFCVDRNIDVDALFTHRWTLDQAREAYELFDTQSAGKGVFER